MRRLRYLVRIAIVAIAFCQLSGAASANLISYWPLDELNGTTTPDVVSGFDMSATNMTAANIVPGQIGSAFSFDNAVQTMLSRVHSPGEDLPVTKHSAFTVSMWTNVVGMNQSDLRLFSEATTAGTDPLFNIGTQQAGADGRLDLFLRQNGSPGHQFSTSQPFDGAWHHVALVVSNDTDYTLYVDGVRDGTTFTGRDLVDFNITSIGGIERGAMARSHWVTGLIDDVSVWKSALTERTIEQLALGVSPAELAGVGLPQGDVNGDMVVDLEDFAVIRDNFQRNDALRAEGDLDLDGVVGLKDFKTWKVVAFPLGGGPVGVPEPGTVVLLAMGLVLLACSSRRWRFGC